jgi:hypothetical protein
MGSGCIDPHFLDLGQLHAPAALPPGKEPRYQLDRRLGGPQSWSGRRGEEKILHPTGTRTPTPRPVASRYTDYAIPAPIRSWVHTLKRHMVFRKTDECTCLNRRNLTVASNLHYYSQKQVWFLSILLMNKCIFLFPVFKWMPYGNIFVVYFHQHYLRH